MGGGLSNFYFNDDGGSVSQAVTSVVDFLNSTEDQRSSSLTWSCGGDIDTLNVGTGTLEATESFAPATGTGTASGDILPPATQGLLRIYTTQIVSGRLLRGRIFLPGAVESFSTLGRPVAAYGTDYNNAAATMISDSNSAWSVWSRTHGTLATVDSAQVWTEWATLRSRRD